uniref:Uncharacterized protein n=1 Tax=Timema genevievae TaxID=629358 RepID=A0A7R9JQX2_TIMGE|nr:unnamed protein product [Timema genevievae]
MLAETKGWSEPLAKDPEVPGTIPGASRFFFVKQWIWNEAYCDISGRPARQHLNRLSERSISAVKDNTSQLLIRELVDEEMSEERPAGRLAHRVRWRTLVGDTAARYTLGIVEIRITSSPQIELWSLA